MGNIRIDKSGSRISVRFPARTWEKAHKIIESLRDMPPAGYRMRGSQVTPKSASGRRCNMKVTFDYVDSRESEFTTDEAREWFHDFAEEAKRGAG